MVGTVTGFIHKIRDAKRRYELEAARNMEPDCAYGAVGNGRYTEANARRRGHATRIEKPELTFWNVLVEVDGDRYLILIDAVSADEARTIVGADWGNENVKSVEAA